RERGCVDEAARCREGGDASAGAGREDVADAESARLEGQRADAGQPAQPEPGDGGELADADGEHDDNGGCGAGEVRGKQGIEQADVSGSETSGPWERRAVESGLGGAADGVAAGLD